MLFLPGDAQWRIPLAMKIPVPLILMFAIFSGPFSSRWRKFYHLDNFLSSLLTSLTIVRKGRHEEGRRFLNLLHDTEGETFIEQELLQIQQQIELEASAETSS